MLLMEASVKGYGNSLLGVFESMTNITIDMHVTLTLISMNGALLENRGHFAPSPLPLLLHYHE